MATPPAHEIELRHHFDDELDAIRLGLVEMGGLVVENIRRAGHALVENDLQQVDVVRHGDEDVNEHYRVLERHTFEILALQQPVATDLRFLVASTRMLYEIERTGDLAVNIANCMARSEGFPNIGAVHALMARLAEESAGLFARSIDALANLDAGAGLALDEQDDVVDLLTSDFYSSISHHQDELGFEHSVQLTRVGRFLERIADHGVNIGENVAYIVTGHFPYDDDASAIDNIE